MNNSASANKAWMVIAGLSILTGASLAFVTWFSGDSILPWFGSTDKAQESGVDIANVAMSLGVGLALVACGGFFVLCGGIFFMMRVGPSWAWPAIALAIIVGVVGVMRVTAEFLGLPFMFQVMELVDDRAEERVALARSLPTIEAESELRRLLRDGDCQTRLQALRSLEELGPDAAPAVPELVDVLEEEVHATMVPEASNTLGKLGPAARSAVPRLVELQRTGDPKWRRWGAAWALLTIEPDKANMGELGIE